MLQAEWEHHDIETAADANAMAKPNIPTVGANQSPEVTV